MNLPDILTRIESATGPDRELDALICAAFVYPPDVAELCRKYGGSPPRIDGHRDGWVVVHDSESEFRYATRAPRFTASLDEALMLLKLMLPVENYWSIDKTSPFSVLSAILKAKISEQGAGERTSDRG